jgi:hypothetical protein
MNDVNEDRSNAAHMQVCVSSAMLAPGLRVQAVRFIWPGTESVLSVENVVQAIDHHAAVNPLHGSSRYTDSQA